MSSRRFVIIGAGISLIAAAACVLPKPRPPHPPAPSTYELRVFALRSDGIAIPGATVYRDNAREDLETVEVDGSVVWRQLAATNVAFNVCAGAPGYFNASTGSDRKCAPVGVAGQAAGVIHITLDARPTPPPPPPPPASAPSWTKSQLLDIQGDLMIWAPDVGCDSAETGIRCDAAGLRAGYVWWLSVPRYPADKRLKLYADAKAQGSTHGAMQVTQCVAGGNGYHDLYPTPTCDGCRGWSATPSCVRCARRI
jgi:hypothetical protein